MHHLAITKEPEFCEVMGNSTFNKVKKHYKFMDA
jgi:hypothetical protein